MIQLGSFSVVLQSHNYLYIDDCNKYNYGDGEGDDVKNNNNNDNNNINNEVNNLFT